ncbi:carbohydrate-binding protein [Streptomyces sp. NPDC004111]|uniref:carbohydrate-binding protein n=1 Tax=Streptomyces sp. NPDC004111 TaxID=3364690 RepID=UPI0036AEB1B0
MTAGNNGASTPEDDDPFGYLYEDGRAAGAQPPSSGGGYGYPGPSSRGVPRTSYNQVRAVGERQYGQQQGGYGQQTQATQPFPQQQQGQSQYGQPNAHYAAPETVPGGAPPRQGPPHGDQGHGGRGRGPNTRGLLIGAIAVVAAVVIGIGAALYFGKSDEKGDQAGGQNAGATGGQSQSEDPSPSKEPSKDTEEPPAELPKAQAGELTLSPGLSTDKTITGARSDSGAYVPLTAPGSSATWKVNVPAAGQYKLSVDYGVPGKNAKADLSVNGKPHGTGLRMDNFANAAEGDWQKGWTNTWATVTATKGENTFVISCPAGCEVNLDRVELKQQ